MDKKNLKPQATQPVYRTTTGQLPPELAELSEETLSLGVAARSRDSIRASSNERVCIPQCSYDGDDVE